MCSRTDYAQVAWAAPPPDGAIGRTSDLTLTETQPYVIISTVLLRVIPYFAANCYEFHSESIQFSTPVLPPPRERQELTQPESYECGQSRAARDLQGRGHAANLARGPCRCPTPSVHPPQSSSASDRGHSVALASAYAPIDRLRFLSARCVSAHTDCSFFPTWRAISADDISLKYRSSRTSRCVSGKSAIAR